MTDDLDWERLARYVTGEATAAERAAVEAWATGSPERERLIASVKRRWAAAGDVSARDVDAAWARLAARLSSVGSGDDDVLSLAARRARWAPTRVLPIAATVVIAAGFGLFWLLSRDRQSLGSGGTVIAEARTGAGQQRTLDLADGSTIVLGAASTVSVRGSPAASDRDVVLSGQALFRVRHDSTRRFVVHAAGTATEDLGTEFDIRAYPEDSVVRVAVIEGMVVVRPDRATNDSAVLRASDVARVDESGRTDVRHEQDVERLLAWTAGEIVFDNAPLSDVARDLQRWFDIECRIADPMLAGLHVTKTKGERGESLDDVLRIIETSLSSLGVKVTRQGRTVTFMRGKPESRVQSPESGGTSLPVSAVGRVGASGREVGA